MTEPIVTDFDVVQAMIREGGSFVKALGQCLQLADPVNFRKLRQAFPDYWATYYDVARTRRKQHPEEL